jgi:hypothetical protein
MCLWFCKTNEYISVSSNKGSVTVGTMDVSDAKVTSEKIRVGNIKSSLHTEGSSVSIAQAGR